MVYAHTMSMKIYSRGRYLPSVTLRPGEVVFDLDGYIQTVNVVGMGWWEDVNHFRHEDGAVEALDVTDHPVVRCELIGILKEKGAL